MMVKRYFLRALCCMLAAIMLLTGCVANKAPDGEKLPEDPDEGNTPGENEDPANPGQSSGEDEQNQDKPTSLKVNLLEQPFGVQKKDLRFSWTVDSEDANGKQTAYRIVVARSASLAAAKNYVFDSDWVTSSDSTAVSLSALASKLEDNALYYWSVAIKDEKGNESPFSDAQPFTTAVGSAWQSTDGVWAGYGENAGRVEVANSDDWTDYALDVEFIIDANALGFTFRAKDTSNFYMWQFKVDNGKAMLYPHVYMNGSFVGGKAIASVAVPEELAFAIGDTIKARIVCDGNDVLTYIADGDEYVLIDERDMSGYGITEGIIGVRTGGSECGRVRSMLVYDPNVENEVLYRSLFEAGHNPFNRSSLAGGMLSVPKGLSTTNMISPDMLMVSHSSTVQDDFAFLRTEQEISMSGVDRAVLSVTARSPEPARQFVYTMYVNGACVGVGPARFGKTADEKTVLYYNSYDVTALLTEGKNAFAAIAYTTADRMFLCQLTLHYADGSTKVVFNSAKNADSWRTLGADKIFGKNNSIGTNYYYAHANNIDSALYPHGFATVGFDDSAWSKAQVGTDITDGGLILMPWESDNVSRYEADADGISVKKLSDGSYVVDLGREIIGSVRFEAELPAAAEVTVYYGEQLNDDGSVKHKMLTGNDYVETWKLKAGKQTVETIDMLAYRYIQFVGCPVAITADMVRGIEIRAAFDEDEASFTSDSKLLNDIYELVAHTIKVTTQDLYVDSQSRERLAYEGDLIINLMAAHAFEDDYSIGRFSSEYLYTHRTWPAEYYLFAPIFAMEDYMATGDDSSLKEYYDVLVTRTYTDKLNDEYDLIALKSTGGSATDSVLIDWPSGERDDYDAGVTYNTVLNCVSVLAYEKLSEIASVVGKTADADRFAALADKLRDALIMELYNSEKGAFADGLNENGEVSSHYSQHATAYALACGVYDGQAMADRLADFIADQGKIKMSVYGSYFLLKGLYETNNGDVANALLLDDDTAADARTWAKMLYTLGATVTAEAWGVNNKNNMTLSHPWGAAPAYAIKNGIFGIVPTTAGYDTFDIRFRTEGIGKASLTVPCIKGSISASFEQAKEAYLATVCVPFNSQATVYVPAADGAKLTLNGEASDAVAKDGFLCVTVGSGEWTLEVK